MSYREKRHRSSFARPNRRVRSFQAHRSLMAQQIDDNLKAPRAKTEAKWLAQPNRYDMPNIDTPRKK